MESEIKHKRNIRKPVTHSARQMYSFYKKKHKGSKIPYWMYKEIIGRFNKKASDAVIFGQVLNLGNRLGNVLIKKIRRNYENPQVNWGESNKLKNQILEKGGVPKGPDTPDGEKWLVYFSDAWYLRWAWSKKRICKVRNASVYKFMPTSDRSKKGDNKDFGKLGNKGKLTLANKVNPNLHTTYETIIKRTNG